MLTILEQPDKICLAEDPVVIRIGTSNTLSSVGNPAQNVISFTYWDVVGSILILNWGTNSVILTCVATPDESGTQYPLRKYGQTLKTWCALLAAALNGNYLLTQDFWITALPKGVSLIAKKNGSGYIISKGEGTTSGGVFSFTEGTDDVPRAYYQIVLQTFIADQEGKFNQIGEDIIIPYNNESDFDISEYLRPELSSNLTWPEIEINSLHVVDYYPLMIKHPELCQIYQFAYMESWNGQQQKIYYSGGKFALLGGSSKQRQAYIRSLGLTFFQMYSGFMTWGPNSKKTNTNTPEKLYWLNTKTGTMNVTLCVLVTYDDAITETLTKATMDTSLGDVIELICSSYRINPGANFPAKKVVSYAIYLKKTGGANLTGKQTFLMDYQFNINEKRFMFRNSFGAFESVRMGGVRQNNIEYQPLLINENLPYDFGWKDTESRNEKNFEIQTFQANSGWKTIQEINWLRDFMLTKEAYELVNGTMLPIVITSMKVAILKDNEYIQALDFEYKRGYIDEHYSPDPSLQKDAINYAVNGFDGDGFGEGFQKISKILGN